jgi:hypothetical protein
MPPFKCWGRDKAGQIIPFSNHCKIHICTQREQKNGIDLATNIISFKTNVSGTLDILPAPIKLKTRS